MILVEYKLDPQDKPRSFHPKTVPSYIVDGGHWENPDGSEKMIGIALEGTIPDNIKTFTLEELQTRQLELHAKYPTKPQLQRSPSEEGNNITDDELKAAIKSWKDSKDKKWDRS